MIHWLQHYGGTDNATGPLYLFWSGSAPTLLQLFEYLVVVGLVVWHHVCHEEGCYRWGRVLDADGNRRCIRCHRRKGANGDT